MWFYKTKIQNFVIMSTFHLPKLLISWMFVPFQVQGQKVVKYFMFKTWLKILLIDLRTQNSLIPKKKKKTEEELPLI